MKKALYILLTFLIVLATLTSCGSKKPTEQDNNNEQDDNNVVESPVTDFEYELSSEGDKIHIKRYIGTSEHVVIPAKIENLPVIKISGVNSGEQTDTKQGVFEGTSVKTVQIPDCLKIIGSRAFKDCKQLTEVKIPKNSNITNINYDSFEGCTALESIDLSSTKLSILGPNAFKNCTNLKSISLPDTTTKIEQNAFYDCTSLFKIELPDSISEIGDKAFCNCFMLESIELPKNLNKLGAEAISNCISLKKVNIPPELNLISYAGHMICKNDSIKQIIFDDGREEINGYCLFSTFSNVEIIFPKNIKKFSATTFYIAESAKLIFKGNCPELLEQDFLYGNLTICYDPNTKGWDECEWIKKHNIELLGEENKQEPSQEPELPKTYDEILANLYNAPEKKFFSYFTKDIDNNGVDELIVIRAGTMITVYTLKDTVKEVGKYDFVTGTLRLLYSNDSSIPGIIYFTVGGGAEHYGYLTIKNDQLLFVKIWDYNYSLSQYGDVDLIVEHTTNKKLIEESKTAYNQNQDIIRIPLESINEPPLSSLDSTLLAIIRNEKPFYSSEQGKNIFIQDYNLKIWEYAIADLDSDNNLELAVMFQSTGDILILRKDGDTVTGYIFGHRAMYRLNKDGTFHWNDNVGNAYGCSKLEFSNGKCNQVELWRVERSNTGPYTYYINNTVVSVQEFDSSKTTAESVVWMTWPDEQ